MIRAAVTIGDPAGIGPEIALRALASPELRARVDAVLVGTREVLDRCATTLGIPLPGQSGIVVEDVPVNGIARLRPGEVQELAGRAAVAYIRRAADLARSGRVDAIVTAPIHKEALRLAGCAHIGHTELLAAEFGVDDPLTLFLTERLRVFFLTRHMSLRQAIEHVTRDSVLSGLRRIHGAMADLGVADPLIAVAALNPHASDGGQFGAEEERELRPAIAAATQLGIRAVGPVPADSVFHQGLEGAYDCVLSLYHDQGHIATKTRDFYGTVTATLGLPVLRTSVDHGTALDVAWTGRANERSLVAAALAASDLLDARTARHSADSPGETHDRSRDA